MSDTATTQGPSAPNGGAIAHFLSAVHQALDLPAPRRGSDQLPYLKLLDQRAHLARASIGRLISNPHSDALDYTSEGDHILHKLADLPPDTYRSRPAEQLRPCSRSCTSRSSPAATAASQRRASRRTIPAGNRERAPLSSGGAAAAAFPDL